MELNKVIIEDIIKKAVREDLGTGDITGGLIFSSRKTGEGEIIVREKGVIAGLEIAEMVYNKYDSDICMIPELNDGDTVEKGDIVAVVKGPVETVLSAERVVLNFLQHLSGIASYTRMIVELIDNYSARIVDTRKTTPGLRMLEKYAVRMGGGTNHRHGLYDAVLIKENHILLADGIKNAVKKISPDLSHTTKIEVEVEELSGVEEALEAGADIIMLDNMDISTMEKAVDIIDGEVIIEASGNVTEENVEEIAECGVDIISVGSITHSAKALDLSFRLNK